MKPHEQLWEDDGEGLVWNKGRFADLVHRPTDNHAQDLTEVYLRGRLIAAAPDMARVLLLILGGDEHTPDCGFGTDPLDNSIPCSTECAAIRAALTKAGVPIP